MQVRGFRLGEGSCEGEGEGEGEGMAKNGASEGGDGEALGDYSIMSRYHMVP